MKIKCKDKEGLEILASYALGVNWEGAGRPTSRFVQYWRGEEVGKDQVLLYAVNYGREYGVLVKEKDLEKAEAMARKFQKQYDEANKKVKKALGPVDGGIMVHSDRDFPIWLNVELANNRQVKYSITPKLSGDTILCTTFYGWGPWKPRSGFPLADLAEHITPELVDYFTESIRKSNKANQGKVDIVKYLKENGIEITNSGKVNKKDMKKIISLIKKMPG